MEPVCGIKQDTKTSEKREEIGFEKRGYYLGQKIAEGSYGKVYKAIFLNTKTHKELRLACKVFLKEKCKKERLDKFVSQELQILTMIHHPNLIDVHSIYHTKSKIYIFMDYVHNGTLLEYLQQKGAVDETKAKFWFYQMARAVRYLHERDIAHRDLKCENVLISRNNNVKITDFGFARLCPPDTLSETFCGSTAYMAPEVLTGTPYSPLVADVWSLGVVLFAMLNAALPFGEKDSSNLVERQLSGHWVVRPAAGSNTVLKLLRAVMCPDVVKRYNVREVVGHTWLDEYNANQVERRDCARNAR